MSEIIATYPRKRPKLSPEEAAIYKAEYLSNRSGTTFFSKLSQKCESWMHRQVAASSKKDATTLEIGAGTLNQLPYEIFKNGSYDIIEPQAYLYENSPQKSRIRGFYNDIRDIEEDLKYDRIISIAVLEHLEDLPFVVAKGALMLKPGGVFHHGIPNEGGFLWGISWRITTGLSYKLRTGFSYANLMRHEHVNQASEIIDVLSVFFDEVNISKFPTPFTHCSLYCSIQCRGPNIDKCNEYLSQWKERRLC